jgi:iron(III) transport system ATP-binding protein
VALARALISEPSILLLDEPLSNLDAKLRENMRFEIRSLQQRLGITAIYVTHSQDEALAVSDEIVIMKNGNILQRDAPEEVYSRPNCSFVADFIGLANIVPCTVRGMGSAHYHIEFPGGQLVMAGKRDRGWKEGDKPLAIIRPENIVLRDKNYRRPGEADNAVSARINKVSFTGNIVNYFAEVPGLEEQFRCQSTPPLRFMENMEVSLGFPPDSCVLVET